MSKSRSAVLEPDVAKTTPVVQRYRSRFHRIRWRMGLVCIVLTVSVIAGARTAWRSDSTDATALPPPPPRVTVSSPLKDTVTSTTVLLAGC